MNKKDYLKAVNVNGKDYNIFNINKLEENKISNISRLPFSIRVLVENLLRNMDDDIVKEEDLLKIAGWKKNYDQPVEIPHHPARVLMQDFTGVPAVVDLASMRDAVEKLGGDPSIINPLVPTELIIDHSIQVDYFGTEDSLKKNVEMEYHRNRERYELLKWAQGSFNNFKVVPPNSGICHQVNLECLGRVIITEEVDGIMTAYPDSLVGTDSHTTMINGIGVMGWGVGGIEAEAVMLGQPYYMSIPEVIGMKLTGELKEGITATDLVLTITEILRQHNVVEKFVEYFGSGYKNLNVPNRATLANMSPEYGATMGFCPVDEKTIEYLEMTGRKDQAGIVEECSKAIGLFYTGEKDPEYSKVIEFDLSEVEPSLAGPSRPQDRITLKTIKPEYYETLDSPIDKETTKAIEKHNLNINGNEAQIRDGSIVIAAITSCTNTSNPSVMIGAGLLAKNAVKKGLKVPHHVKTSLAPGSKVVSQYLDNSGLTSYLELLGFNIVAYGCTTCIGNSGPLHSEIEKLIDEKDINTASVLSGNRNFEARIHQKIKSNYLASPLLVIAFAIAGRIDIDLNTEPVGFDPNGDSVYLKDLWPSNTEILELVTKYVTNDLYESEFKHIFEGDEFWKELIVPEGTTFKWDDNSTYIKNPPYFKNFDLELSNAPEVKDARLLLLLGDSVTTDHIS
ncbi:MAG: aconitate hydratase AcnA, partial [Desulfobacteraceae bacterium]|nr:aconitate hydratase AcnA [Desulfobacteraceae bacterium]